MTGRRRSQRVLAGRLSAWIVLVAIGAAASVAHGDSSSTAPSGHAPDAPKSDAATLAAVLASYAGRWARIDDPAAEAARLESIDEAVSDLAWIVRRMASRVLRRSAVPPGAVQFDWDGDALHQVVESDNGRFSRPVHLHGPPQTLEDKRGEPFTSRWTLTPSGLEVRWTQEQANGTTRYRLVPGTDSMVVEHSIQVTAIDGVDEIAYRNRFGRERLSAVSAGAARTDEAAEGTERR